MSLTMYMWMVLMGCFSLDCCSVLHAPNTPIFVVFIMYSMWLASSASNGSAT
ncbi:hypothetical protein B0H16DRAFT_1737601 [Mycena metata]|uniref:Uncharacterized protein n=1 Tax=Mycena metata TaxID=1033252 RepID=A0AAD7HKB7_9AGAR|nr:hypothetical protein B0H16DRAFT_1737601 [Mycena metata]